MKKINKTNKGFTLIEMLVVVLIIGILAGIALPQYQMAVTKAKVASILPLMRRWKDAWSEYKLLNGDYGKGNESMADATTVGVNWPSDWTCEEDEVTCYHDYWHFCSSNSEDRTGYVVCKHEINNDSWFAIFMYQSDEPNENIRGMTTCEFGGEGEKVCKAIGGQALENVEGYWSPVYKLN